jgi:ribosomal protein L11 methyltransferase
MQALLLACRSEDKDRLVAELWEQGTAGIIEHERPADQFLLEAFFRRPFPLDSWRDWNAHWEPVEDVNWARLVMESWEPIVVGSRFFVVPDWRQDPTPPGRLRLEVRPGLALGTGYHPTTQMCLEAMERHFTAGKRFLDVGAGSGILAHAARLLGAGQVVACDVDLQAVESAVGNLERTRVPALVFAGSVTALAAGSADFLAANISPDTVITMIPKMARVLAPGGHAVLSGFEPHHLDSVRTAAATTGFETLESITRDAWACVVAQSTGPPESSPPRPVEARAGV